MDRFGKMRGPDRSPEIAPEAAGTSPAPQLGGLSPAATGRLAMIGALVVALICLAFSVRWLVDESRQPGVGLFVLPIVAIAALAATAFAEKTWSARPSRTTELGNTTRLVSIGAILLVVPSMLIAFAGDDRRGNAGGIDLACPEGEVPDAGFVDVLPESSHARAVNCLAWWGIVSAEGESFQPSSTLTRAQMATTIDRTTTAAGAELADGDLTFTDIDDDTHADAIARVAAADIMGGRNAEAFDPGGTVTRAQMATLVARVYEHVAGEPLAGAEEGDDPAFDDVGESLHADNIRAAAAAGIITGKDGRFQPGDSVTRAQMATMLARTLDILVLDGATELPD